MKIILLSGGLGHSLWPLTNASRAKPTLKLFQHPDSAEYESLLQRVCRQLDAAHLLEHTYLSTTKEQVDSIRSQLGNDIRLIVEPEPRDTFPAVALAAAYLHAVEKLDPHEALCVWPADYYAAEPAFLHRLVQLETELQQSGADILLLSQERFMASPDNKEAQKLIKGKTLGVQGVFAFKLKSIIDLLVENGFPTDYSSLTEQYGLLPAASFEAEIEKARNIFVKPFEGYWRDLDTWEDFTQEMKTNLIGKGTISNDTSNAHLINELSIPVLINGLSDVIVAVSHDGILISNKEKSAAVKPLIQHLLGRPMVEERRWGSYRVLHNETLPDGSKVLTKSISLLAGKNISYQTHAKRSEIWTITSGEGLFVLEDTMKKVAPGDVLEISTGSKHAIKALTDVQLIEVQLGSDLVETDITRICMNWEEIEERCSKGDA